LQPNEEDKVNEHTGSTQSKTADAGDESSDGSISDSDAENDKGAFVIYFMFYKYNNIKKLHDRLYTTAITKK